MSFQDFIILVSGSPLIPAELKTKLLTAAEYYTLEKRADIAVIIRKTEEDFLAAAKTKQAKVASVAAAVEQIKLAALHKEEAQQHDAEQHMIAAIEADIMIM